MSDKVEEKPRLGFLGRLFGRRAAPAPAPAIDEQETIVLETPVRPEVEAPAAPVVEEPIGPEIDSPAAPVIEEPIGPEIDAPAAPGVEKPIGPEIEEPAAPIVEDPVGPEVEEPAPPVVEEPIGPEIESPAAPVVDEPIAPEVDAPLASLASETATAKTGLIGRLFGRKGAPAIDEPSAPVETPAAESTRSWISRLTFGLARSSSAIGRGIVDIFTKRKLDGASLDDLEDILIQADLGIGAATRIREAIGRGRYEKGIDPDEVKALLADEVERTLAPIARPLVLDPRIRPFVILVVGVNGSGKTTTIGKLAAKFVAEGHKVLLAAGDTFRAAAIEQLKIWAGRVGAEIVAREQGGDAAGLAFDAITRARATGADVVLIDTAGRLQNRAELMSELEKIIRVIRKVDPAAPHATLLVLDATVGQNALSQVEIFGRIAGVTGLVMTKLDGTARGGILVAIADNFKLPVHFIGVGETVDDLEPFAARDFARAIAGIEQE